VKEVRCDFSFNKFDDVKDGDDEWKGWKVQGRWTMKTGVIKFANFNFINNVLIK
jgi:hypothetical protein